MYNPLTREQERDLIHQWQVNQCERSRLALYEAFLPLIQKQARKRKHLEFDDAVQIASIGFVKALDTFDLDNGARFSTHLGWLIRASYADKTDKRYDRNKGYEVTILDAPIIHDTQYPETMGTMLPDPTPLNYDHGTVRRGLRGLLQDFTQRDRIILAGRMHDLRLQDLADHYGLTRERIRQIEKKALDTLRKRVPQGYRYYLEE